MSHYHRNKDFHNKEEGYYKKEETHQYHKGKDMK
jgi:hypothetical protein